MIIKTEAIVLQTRRYRESSKIVTLYTREYGRVSVVARGVLRPKNKSGSVLQPMSHISAVIYRKEGRDLQNLSTVEGIGRRSVMMTSLERISAAMAIVEMVTATSHDEERNDALFDTLTTALDRLDDASACETSVQLWFSFRLAAILGYAIDPEHCAVCGESFNLLRDPVPFSLSGGAPLCLEHHDATPFRSIRRSAYDLFRALVAADIDSAAALAQTSDEATELIDLSTSFIRYHVEGLRKLRVRGVSAKVLDVETQQKA